MRNLILLLSVVVVASHLSFQAPSVHAQACTDDYMTIDTFVGTIVEIVPAPEPFSSADMLLEGPDNCSPLLMQVLKADAAQCRIGDKRAASLSPIREPRLEHRSCAQHLYAARRRLFLRPVRNLRITFMPC